jgi:hypothetical protein
MSRSAWAVGGTIFAALMMTVAGAWQVLVGIAAIAKDDLFVTGAEYTYMFDLTGWGWVHLIIGALALAAGLSLFSGAAWARAVGVVVAIGSMISNFMWLPFQPWWSIMVIALNVFVIWSLANVGDRLESPGRRS